VDVRTKSAVLWGLVGALTFLVLHQGYLLATGDGVSIFEAFAVAVVVGAVTAVVSYALEHRLAA
jgi:hypothetical protein